MGQRRILVIGSQCDALGPLNFLPELAKQLYDVFTNPNIGMCVSALEGQKGLLIDQGSSEVRAAIKTAFNHASQKGDTLIVALIGHGVSVEDDDFYYMAKDSSAQPDSEIAVQLVQILKESYRQNSFIDGLIVLVDTCHAGVAAMAAAEHLARRVKFSTRCEIMTATGSDPAFGGCFTRVLIDTLKQGISKKRGDTLLCIDFFGLVKQKQACGAKQVPRRISIDADEGLFLAKNVALAAKQHPWVKMGMWSEIERHTQCFQPTPQLRALVEASADQQCLALVGKTGSGKSALMAGLARPEVTEGQVPEGFLQAIIFLSQATDSATLASELSHQLQISVEGFADALNAFQASILPDEFNKMDLMQRSVVAPLRRLPQTQLIRIGVDSLDQLPDSASLGVYRALNSLTQEADLTHVRLVVSSRPDTNLPVRAKVQELGQASDDELMAYLIRHDVPSAYRQAILEQAEGSWLIASLLADLAMKANLEPDELPSELVKIYDRLLEDAEATQRNIRWREQLRPVLSVLAISGIGPVLPIALLCKASQRLGGPAKLSHIRDILVDLRGFIDRRSPGTEEECDGLFHATFGEYLRNAGEGLFSVDVREAKAALVNAIAELAPMEQNDPNNPIHQYAATIEAQLLWALEKRNQALTSLSQRESNNPSENLTRWDSWYKFIAKNLKPENLTLLQTRYQIARYTGKSGKLEEALKLFRQLLEDQKKVSEKNQNICHGELYKLMLQTRLKISTYTGYIGDFGKSQELCQKLLSDLEQVLGKDDRETLRARLNIAANYHDSGNVKKALELCEDLLVDQLRVLEKDDEDILRTRLNIASYTGDIVDVTEDLIERKKLLQLNQQLLLDQERILGKEHPHTLLTRLNIAIETSEIGNAKEALKLCDQLLLDQVRVLGKDHPSTLLTRLNIADINSDIGNTKKALQLYEKLLTDQERVFHSKHHNQILITRCNIADVTARLGDTRKAIDLYDELLPDMERALGKNHPNTIRTRKLRDHLKGTSKNRFELRSQ
jgi:tetratricopeptide (TPR) repeat protein